MTIGALLLFFALLLLVAVAVAFLVEWRVERHSAGIREAFQLALGGLRNDLAIAKLLRPAEEAPAPSPAPSPQPARSQPRPLPPPPERRLVRITNDDDDDHRRPTVEMMPGGLELIGDRESAEELTRVSPRR